MEYQDKIKWLRRYGESVSEIARLEAEIETWRARAEKVTPSFSLAPGGGGGDRIPSAVESIEACMTARERELEALCSLRDEIGGKIDALSGKRLARLLRLRYIDGLRLSKISELEHLEVRWVRRLLKKAIEKLTL